jgi:large subunit ribosomal protein L15
MVVYKRKKNTRQHGGTTHGWGARKKHRGAGNRGGRGRAGSGKRGDCKKPGLLWKKGHKHYGKVGFNSHSRTKITALNISDLQSKLDHYVAEKLAEKKGDVYTIDLSKIGFNKLLGTGILSKKMNITTEYASEKAVSRVEEAGGKVTVTASSGSEE